MLFPSKLKKSSLAITFKFIAAFVIILSFFLFLYPPTLRAQTPSADAIAIRVMPNPNHFSPIRWYNEQKFHGSPQEMVVDGYDAIRDGNIVYVNAANVANNNFYTNIYAISFNLGADVSTGDIFGQILQYWKFNNNLMTGNNAGHCIDAKNNVSECFKANGELQFLKYTAEDNEPVHLVPTIETEGTNKVYALSNLQQISSPGFMAVDVSKKYYLSGKFKSVGTPQSIIFFGFIPYDANKNVIDSWHALRTGSANTVRDISPTQITTADPISGWHNPVSPAYVRSLGFYYDGITTHLPDDIWYVLDWGQGPTPDGKCLNLSAWDYRFYCNDSSYGAYSTASGNTIALNAALPARITDRIAFGTTKVMNHFAGGSYIYAAASNVTLNSNEWQTFKVAITGSDFNTYSQFWPETKFAKILILANYNWNSTDHNYNLPTTKLLLDDITFSTEECLNITGNSSDDSVQAAYDAYSSSHATCQNVSECAQNEYCTSIKAAAVRDTGRLADLAELNTLLKNYRNSNNDTCPQVAQGSYVPNHAVSTWPSWQGTLGKNLGQSLPVDPINKLGKCGSELTVNASTYASNNLGCGGGVSGTSVYSYCNSSWTYNLNAPLDSNYEVFALTSNNNGGINGEDLSTLPINQSNGCRSQEGINHKIEIFVDGEPTSRGFICNGATLPTNPQYGKVQIGHLSRGNHSITLAFTNDYTLTPPGQTAYHDSNIKIFRLGITSADSFDETTCWDSQRKIFSKPIVPAPPYAMELPSNSWAYSYVADKDGRKCAINTRLESTYGNLINAGCVDGETKSCPNTPVAASVNASNPTNALAVDCTGITAFPGSPVSAFLKISPQKNTTINSVVITDMVSTWNTALPIVNQYQSGYFWQLRSPGGGAAPATPGNYSFKVNITDSTGYTLSKDCSIKVLNSYIIISPINDPAPVMQGHSLNEIKIKAAVKNIALAPISFKFIVKDPATSAILNNNHIVNQGFYSGADISTGWVPGSNLGSIDQKEYYRKFDNGEVIANAGPNGAGKDYMVEVQAKDTANNIAFTNFIIHVYNDPPTGSTRNISLTASTTGQISEKIVDASDDQTNFDLGKVSLTGQTFSNNSVMPNGLTDITSSNHEINPNRLYTYLFTGQLANTNVFDAVSRAYNLVVRIKDRFDVWRNFNFTVTVNNGKPSLDYTNCPDTAVRFTDSYIPCKIKANDPDSNKIQSVVVNDNTDLPLTSKIGLTMNSGGIADFSFAPNGNRNFASPPDHPVKFSAVDEFGLAGDQSVWNLRINNYCGDNFKDNDSTTGRNTERAGGPANDGNEDCDVPAGNQPATAFNGLASSPSDSNAGKWYECTGQCTDRTNCANTCKYTGGYCGDNIRQASHREGCDGTDNISTGATIRSGSSAAKQYQCATGSCVPTGGWCGDNIIQNGSGNFNAGENCDKSNWTKVPGTSDASNQYLCNNDCKQYGGFCGDGVLQTAQGEECDDGNKTSNDGCSSSCLKECSSFNFDPNLSALTSVQSADNIIYDSNYSDTPPAADVAPYNTIKINDGPAPTPYIWIADTNNTGIVYKYRTFTGPKKLADGWDINVIEQVGQLCGQTPSYPGQPSRTAVNVETGDIWVAYRTGDTLRKFNIDGTFQCEKTGIAGARGVAIRADGNVWVGGYGTTNMYLINKDTCAVISTYDTNGKTDPNGASCTTGTYGMAIGLDGSSVWIAGSNSGRVVNINETGCLKSIATGNYGITVDLNGNPQYTDISGITLDSFGGVWQARYTSTNAYRHSDFPAFPIPIGYGTHGAAGDSKGKVWFVEMEGNRFASYDVTTQVITQYTAPAGTNAYTYSDMTGINRAMLLRSATWLSKELTVSGSEFFWGKISYMQNIPAKSQVNTYLRLKNGGVWSSWIDSSVWNSSASTQRAGTSMQIKVMLKSQNQSKTPSVGDIKFTCP